MQDVNCFTIVCQCACLSVCLQVIYPFCKCFLCKYLSQPPQYFEASLGVLYCDIWFMACTTFCLMTQCIFWRFIKLGCGGITYGHWLTGFLSHMVNWHHLVLLNDRIGKLLAHHKIHDQEVYLSWHHLVLLNARIGKLLDHVFYGELLNEDSMFVLIYHQLFYSRTATRRLLKFLKMYGVLLKKGK